MVKENVSEKVRIKNIDEKRNFVIEEIIQNDLMKKMCTKSL